MVANPYNSSRLFSLCVAHLPLLMLHSSSRHVVQLSSNEVQSDTGRTESNQAGNNRNIRKYNTNNHNTNNKRNSQFASAPPGPSLRLENPYKVVKVVDQVAAESETELVEGSRVANRNEQYEERRGGGNSQSNSNQGPNSRSSNRPRSSAGGGPSLLPKADPAADVGAAPRKSSFVCLDDLCVCVCVCRSEERGLDWIVMFSGMSSTPWL
jgi:hypothetical protein